MKVKVLLGAMVVIVFMLISKIFYPENYKVLGNIVAPVVVNIHTKNNSCDGYLVKYKDSQSQTAASFPGSQPYALGLNRQGSISKPSDEYICSSKNHDVRYLTKKIWLEVNGDESLRDLDNVAVFIGKKVFAYKPSELKLSKEGDSTIIDFPNSMRLDDSRYINSYSGINIMVNTLLYMMTYPIIFIVALTIVIVFCIDSSLSSGNAWLLIKNNHTKLLAAFVIVGFLLRINSYNVYDLWWDELYSSTIASNVDKDFWSVFVDPGNPPLYFFMLKVFFIIFGWTPDVARIMSVIIGTVSILTSYLFIRNHINKETALLGALLLSVSQYSLGASNEVRAYVLELTLTPVVANYLLNMIKRVNYKDLVKYIVYGSMLVNTHYYGSIFIFSSFLFCIALMYRDKRNQLYKILLSNVVIAISLLPFIIRTAYQYTFMDKSFNSWIKTPGFNDLALVLSNALGSGTLLSIFIISAVIALCTSKKDYINEDKIGLMYCVSMVLLIIVVPFAVSYYRPIFVQKYVGCAMYPFVIATISTVAVNLRVRYRSLFVTLFAVLSISDLTNQKIKSIGLGGYGTKVQMALRYIEQESKLTDGKANYLVASNIEIKDLLKFYNINFNGKIVEASELNKDIKGNIYLFSQSKRDIENIANIYGSKADVIDFPLLEEGTTVANKIIVK